jgi:carbon storage regulator CsrA
MLILTRKAGESITIEGSIRVTIQAIRGHQVRLGIAAPAEIQIFRQELLERDRSEPKAAPAITLVGSGMPPSSGPAG